MSHDWQHWSRERAQRQQLTRGMQSPDETLYPREIATAIASEYRAIVAPDFRQILLEGRTKIVRILRQQPEWAFPERTRKGALLQRIEKALTTRPDVEAFRDLLEGLELEMVAWAATGYVVGVEMGKQITRAPRGLREGPGCWKRDRHRDGTGEPFRIHLDAGGNGHP
jgi:hypothetical protein